MEDNSCIEEFFYVKQSYLKRILYLYFSLIIILFYIFLINNKKEDMVIICTFLVNLISYFIFLGYSRVSISKEISSIIKSHLAFFILLGFIALLKIDLLFLSQIFMFNCDRSIVENIYILFAIPVYSILLSTKIKILPNKETVVYGAIMVMLLVFNYFSNHSSRIHNVIYIIIYMVDLILILCILVVFKLYRLRKNDCINIAGVITIVLFLLDGISIIYLKNLIIINVVSIVKFISINIFLSHLISKTVEVSNRILFKDMHNINYNLETINSNIAHRNIKLQNTREELEAANRVYRDFIKLANIPMIIINIGTKRINFCNNEFVKITMKNNLKSIINKKVDKFINIQGGNEILLNLKCGQKVLGYVENKDEVRLFEINFVILNERIGELLLLFDDITEKKNTERIKLELERIQKNEKIKNNFLSSISHDLKTPIGIIDSAVQLQKVFLRKKDFESVEKYNQICKENCVYLTRLTNNLIDISRITEQLLQPILNIDNIVPFLESKVDIIREYAIFNNRKIIFDTNDEEVFVKYDKEFMERIILNLLSNSIKYTSEGGLIEVSVIAKKESVKIEFCDSGCGMTDEFIKEAFNIYTMENYNDSKKNKSSGIGLFVVYNLIEMQEGKIDVESKVGEGSKFIITFKREQVYEPVC